MEPRWLPLTAPPQPNISPTAQAACLIESAKQDRGEINHDRPGVKPVAPLSKEQKRLPASLSSEAPSPCRSPRPEPSGNSRPLSYKPSSPCASTPHCLTPSYLSKGTVPSLIENCYHTDVINKPVAIHKCHPPLSLASFRHGSEGPSSAADEQDRAFLEIALLRSIPQRNPSKTMILKKVMDYIMMLEQRNERLLQQNIELQSRLVLFIMGPDPASQVRHP
ncbi:hypothetical protein DER44DRAFT_93119 [Fusarium oxysporum]|nr:hypothetical protein DER44DRAFT_93119 [Fusarium oxysporum]